MKNENGNNCSPYNWAQPETTAVLFNDIDTDNEDDFKWHVEFAEAMTPRGLSCLEANLILVYSIRNEDYIERLDRIKDACFQADMMSAGLIVVDKDTAEQVLDSISTAMKEDNDE